MTANQHKGTTMEEEGRKEFIRQVFNTVCEQYGQGELRFFENAASHLPALLNLKGDEKLLDIAAGTGLASTLLASHLPDGQVTGIDLSEGMLEKAQTRARSMGLNNIDFQQMDMTQMDLPEKHFDVINSSFGVFFVEDFEQLVQHVSSRLKPGGRFSTTHFAKGSMAPMQDMIMQRLQQYGVEVPGVSWSQLDSEEANRELYETAGFKNITHCRNQVGYHFKDAEGWWEVVWWAGFRGFVNQIAADEAEQFKQEHLAEINKLADGEGIYFNVEVIHTIGEKV
jgi:ubiquinone/menaquinone biosynthesis C-methylase UbiE